MLSFQHHLPAPLGLFKLQPHLPAALTAVAVLLTHFQQLANPTHIAGTAGLDPFADPDLFFGEFLVETRPGLIFCILHIFPAVQKLRVVTFIILQLPTIDLDDPVGQFADKSPVVADENQRFPQAQQKLLQPLDAGNVQVIGRLIKEQQIRFPDQGSGDQNTSFETTRKILQLCFGA